MVRVRKSGGELELAAPSYRLVFDTTRPWAATLHAGTGQTIAHLFTGAAVDTTSGPSELRGCGQPVLTRGPDDAVIVTFDIELAPWSAAQLVFTCTDADCGYCVEVLGQREITSVRLLQGRVAADLEPLGLGASYFRPGYERRYGALARGSRWAGPRVWSWRPNAAQLELPRPWEDVVIDLRDDPARDGGLDSFRPAPWAFGLELGEGQPWALVGLAPQPDQLGFGHFALRGDDSFGFELSCEGQQVSGLWRSPELVFTSGARDHEAALRAYVDCLRRRGLAPEVPRAPAAWWRRPIFDGRGEQAALAPRGDATSACTEQTYREALFRLGRAGLSPGQVWIGPGWQGDNLSARDDRWTDLPGFIAEQHRQDRRVVLAWAARPDVAVAESAELARWAVDAAGLGADGLVLTDLPWGNAGELAAHLAAVRAAFATVRADALLAAPCINPCLSSAIDLAGTGGLWSDRRSVARAIERRAMLARPMLRGALLAVQDLHAPGLEAWREAISLGPELGVPVLSYSDRLDLTGEPLEAEDFELVAAAWRRAAAELGP